MLKEYFEEKKVLKTVRFSLKSLKRTADVKGITCTNVLQVKVLVSFLSHVNKNIIHSFIHSRYNSEMYYRYYELKLTLEDVETTEEIIHVPERRQATSPRLRSVDRLSSSSSETVEPLSSPQSTILPGGLTAKHEAIASEQLTTSSCEERQRFVIKAVCDPCNGKRLNLKVDHHHEQPIVHCVASLRLRFASGLT